MPQGWTKRLKRHAKEPIVFLVLGVTQTGPWRAFAVLDSFSLSPSHLQANSPLLVSSIDATNYDYVMVVREEIVKKNGWLK